MSWPPVGMPRTAEDDERAHRRKQADVRCHRGRHLGHPLDQGQRHLLGGPGRGGRLGQPGQQSAGHRAAPDAVGQAGPDQCLATHLGHRRHAGLGEVVGLAVQRPGHLERGRDVALVLGHRSGPYHSCPPGLLAVVPWASRKRAAGAAPGAPRSRRRRHSHRTRPASDRPRVAMPSTVTTAGRRRARGARPPAELPIPVSTRRCRHESPGAGRGDGWRCRPSRATLPET